MINTVSNGLLGIWSLKEYVVEIKATGQKNYPMGLHPHGYATFCENGKVIVMLTAEVRLPARNDSDATGLLNTLVAYAGSYRLEGNEWVTSVEVAWKPEWVGTEQRRFFAIVGDEMVVTTEWRVMPNWQAMGMQRSILTFARINS